ncbi:MAG: hypothetical protein ACOCRO_10835 [Halanaerobiales bacterium]
MQLVGEALKKYKKLHRYTQVVRNWNYHNAVQYYKDNIKPGF